MNQKGLFTAEKAPWVEYLVIDKNGKRKLKLNTPLKIRKAYKEHLKNEKECLKNNTPIAK